MSYNPTLLGQFIYTGGEIGGPFYNDPLGSSPQTIDIPITADIPNGSVIVVMAARQFGTGGYFQNLRIGSQAITPTTPLVANTDYATGTNVSIDVQNLIFAAIEVWLLNGFESGFQVGGTPPTGLGLYLSLLALQADVNGNLPGDPIGHSETDSPTVTQIAAGVKVNGVPPSQSTRYRDAYRFVRYEDSDPSHNWGLTSSSLTLDGTQTSSLSISTATLRIYPTNLGGGKNVMRRHPLFGESWFVGNGFPGAPSTNRELVGSKDGSAPRTNKVWSIPSASPGVDGFSFGIRKTGQHDVFYCSGGVCKYFGSRKNGADLVAGITAMTLASGSYSMVSHVYDDKSGLFHVMLYKTTDGKWYYMKCPKNPATEQPDPTGVTPVAVITASASYAELTMRENGTLDFSYISGGTAGIISNRKGGNGAWS